MNLRRLFREHPESVGETYLEHLGFAGRFGLRMLRGGVACLIHALLPFAFRNAGSDCIRELHEQMIASRRNANENLRQIGAAHH
jgi:hypothetical protein